MSDTAFRPIEWVYASQTDVGTVRAANEDALIALPESGLWAVADGMGGHEIGDIASTKIVEALAAVPNLPKLSDYVDAVEDALLNVNQEIMEYAGIMLESGTMGSTLAALVIRGRVGVCLWVGDSRIYRYRNGWLQQLSRDHSQVEEMLRMGLITEAETHNHPQKNVITRAIGGESELYVDINVFSTQIGDTFLICSDGLYNSVKQDDIEFHLSTRSIEQSVSELMNKSLSNRAADNVSIVIVRGIPDKL
ncbi:PP2C family protein-serine/threonine phosphatase [Teredinibacter haidensis]|uniref:PP2C family protein-serine/threonine phosphatase n=1 Tax=Teredinibacter haidensis TaxID=2731755 RepID=UPI000948BB2D|nr:protein phosphatase 2C domain-containing protein [Teredinibacter haidensis]